MIVQALDIKAWMHERSEEIRADIEKSLDGMSAGSIQIHYDGGVVTVRTERMTWWRHASPDDIRSLADRLALVAEDPTMILGVTNTGDWRKETEARRARRQVEIAAAEPLRIEAREGRDVIDSGKHEISAIDILMPLRHGAFIRGDVVKGLMAQDLPIRWYVDAGPDLEVPPEMIERFSPATTSAFWRRHIYRLLKILAKRNRLLGLGDSPYVYFADSDVKIPPAVLGGMVGALHRNPLLGATGLIYQVDMPHFDSHLTAGSMMLRRADLSAIGPLRGSPCECSFIRNRLAEIGKVVVTVESVHAHQWKRTILDDTRRDPGDEEEWRSEEACPRCGELRNQLPDHAYHDVVVHPRDDGSLPLERMAELVTVYDDAFRVFVK
jgi:hypothetical protein